MNKIITISREFGSGGREIGRRLAEAMKIAYYDQEIVAALIKRTKKAEEYVRYMEKERPLPLLPITTARTFGLPTNYAVTENLNFYMQESKIIQEVAEKSDCVIVGRCADYILKDNPNCINVFICADRADRIKRIAERYDVSEKKALDRIKRMDRERKYYYETHTGQEWGSISSHEILLNASLLGIEGTVDILEGIYKR